jgi:hypothetical protein
MIVQFRLRRADAVEWTTIDPVLQDGEPGWEQDTNRIKMGDGVTPWSGLGYATYPATEFEQMIGDITQNLTELDASVAKAADSALTATTQANAAAASAVDASTSAADAEAAEVRVTAIGATNDTQTASFVNNPSSATTVALTTTYPSLSDKVNNIQAESKSLHPPNRARSQMFDGTSHPLSTYYSTLAAAQALYPHATALTDETDWAALQLAVNSAISFPRQFGQQATDWRQYGTAKIELPIGAHVVVNRPIIKAPDTNKNYMICSPTIWGARIRYTGTDNGRIFVFERDSVGCVLDINNLVLQNGGVLLRGPFRGDIRVGNGCSIIDTPHPAIQTEDTNAAINQLGVVGINITNLYTNGCAGGFWMLSSTACIVTLRDSRFIANMDIPLKIDSIDVLVENVDFTGVARAKAEAGTGPYIQVTAAISAVSNVDIRDVRCGSEYISTGTPYEGAPPREYILIGEPNVIGGSGVTNVRLRKVAFRSNAPSAVMARAAIQVNVGATLDVDDCDFEGFNDWLVDEAYLDSVNAPVTESRWGHRNTYATLTSGQPIFSRGGQHWMTTTKAPPVDNRTVMNPGTGPNLAPADPASWSVVSATVGAAVAGGPNGAFYYPITKNAAGGRISRVMTLTPGKRYCFGVIARKQAGSPTTRTFKFRCQFNGGTTVIAVDSRAIRLDDDWVTYFVRIPYVPASATTTTCAVYVDDMEASPTGGMDIFRMFVSEGWSPKFPQDNLVLSPRKNAPSPVTTGMMYLADGVSWDPLARGGSEQYLVFWTGTAYHAVSTVPVSTTPPFVATSTVATQVTNQTADGPLVTFPNIPAAQLHVGDRIKLRAQGTMDSQITPGAFNIRLRANGSLALTNSAITSSSTAAGTNLPWAFDLDIIILATGVGGSILGTQIRASGNANTRTQDTVSTDFSVDLSGGLLLSETAAFGTASVSNIIRHLGSSLEKV